jgi:integrase
VSLRIEIRDPRIGRLSIAAGTADPKERDRRRASLLQLVETERGRAIIDKLRRRKLKLEAVHAAVLTLDLGALENAARLAEAPPIGLGDTIDAWLKVLQGANRSVQTIEFYRSICNGMEATFGVVRDHGEVTRDRSIAEITRAEGEAWLTEPKQKARPWAPRTQTAAASVARQVWDRAITLDEERAERTGTPRTLVRNFWRRDGSRKGIKAPKIRRTRVEFLQRNEAARLLRAVKHTPNGAWIAVGLYAGLRGGEAANLRLGIDVHLDRGVLKIQNRAGQFAWHTKSDNSVRDVPIHPALARWLRLHIREGFAGQTYLFRTPGQDRPISRSTWRTWTQDAYKAAGIRYGRKKDALVYHSLRHTFASWLTIADVHPLKIAKLMGDDVSEVLKTYSHLVRENLEEAIGRL